MLCKNSRDTVLVLIGVAVYFGYCHRSLNNSSCCFAFLNSVILQILQCCLSKQLCQLSSLLHWILFWEVQYSSLHMPGLSNSGKETTSRWNKTIKFVLLFFSAWMYWFWGVGGVLVWGWVAMCLRFLLFTSPSDALFSQYSTESF